MNPPEPNSADLNAIASDSIPKSDINPQPPQSLGTFLDRLYGTLFLPQVTFEQLKANPSFVQAAIVIALVNILETLNKENAHTSTYTHPLTHPPTHPPTHPQTQT